jgi:hypothetical protein
MDVNSPTRVSLREGSARLNWIIEARPDRSRDFIAFLLFLLIGLCGVGAALLGAGLVSLWVAGWSALFAAIAWRFLAAARNKNSWVVRAGPDEVLVNLRSFYNHQFDEEHRVVAVLPASCIRSMQMRCEEGLSARLGQFHIQEVRTPRTFLAIDIAGDLSELAEELAREGERRVSTGRQSSRVKHVPVTLLGKSVLQIAWNNETTHLRPPLREFGTMLTRWYPCTAQTGSDAAGIATLTTEQQEERLRTIASSGRLIPAIALAKRLYRLSTAQAKRLVQRL